MDLDQIINSSDAPKKHKPTEEQQAILDFANDSKDNLLINALAGAAKTSTLVMLADYKRMSQTQILCLAFNKKIADEMRTRLPTNCTSMTLNSLGHRVWGQSLGRRLSRPDTKKNYNILRDLIDKERKDLQEHLFENFSYLLKTMQLAKACGYVPERCNRQHSSLMDDIEFFSHIDEPLEAFEESIVKKALLTSIDLAFEAEIDFDDQIYMSTLFPCSFPSFPVTMIDEAQDLSALNHLMLKKLVKDRRVIAVGDPCQAIYGFRGAHEESMSLLQQSFNMTEKILSISFRCPKAIVKEALWRAPHMQYPEWAKDGAVFRKEKWTIEDLPQDAVIICRNNAPLFSQAIRFLSDGRYPELIGNDIGKSLIKELKKLGPPELTADEVRDKIVHYETVRLSRNRDKGKVKDFCECLRIFTRHGDTLRDIIGYADYVCNMSGPIKMMTGHKSKGLEFPHVFLLNEHLLRLQEGSQDRNLLYVMQTRAQDTLTYVNSEFYMARNKETD